MSDFDVPGKELSDYIVEGFADVKRERVIGHGEDSIECLCGNAPHLDGFYCSDKDGTAREGEYGPTPEWDGDHITCNQCGRVIDFSDRGADWSAPVVGRTAVQA